MNISAIIRSWRIQTKKNSLFVWCLTGLLFIYILFAFYEIMKWMTSKEIEGFSDTSKNINLRPTPEYMSILAEHQKKGMFPWRWLQDDNGNILPIVLLSAFFRDDESRDRYQEYIDNNVKVVGITAYKTFLKPIHDPSEDKYHLMDDFDYAGKIKNWLACFKRPYEYGFTREHNLIDISESDFYDVDTTPLPPKIYDIIYVCLNDDETNCPMDGWNAINRNFELALKCFPIMIEKHGLKILVVGRTGCGLEEQFGSNITTIGFLPWSEFQDKIRESRMLFVPNIMDASPRVIAEAMTKGLPVIMNNNITCGSKYVTADTGELFNDENDFSIALSKTLKKYDDISPNKVKDWWAANYGVKRSATRLRNFLVNCYPGLIDNVEEVKFL